MSRFSPLLALVALCLGLQTACDSPFVKGWRDNEKTARSPEQQCEAVKGHQWVNGTCQKQGSFNLDGVSEADCKNFVDTYWKDDKCVYFRDLETAEDCSSVGWTWKNSQCMSPAQAECLTDPSSDWVVDHCASRPTISFTGSATQALAVGGIFEPLVLTLSPGATASIIDQNCGDFFVISGEKVTSVAAGDHPSCEADVVADVGGAKSLNIHLKATIDKGFLAYCNQFLGNGEAARKEPELAKTVFKLINASEKVKCDDAATALSLVTSFNMSNAGITDVRPLAGFTQIFAIDLSDNPGLKDISALAYLPRLQLLNMDGTGLSKASARTEANCPYKEGVAFGVWEFCRPAE